MPLFVVCLGCPGVQLLWSFTVWKALECATIRCNYSYKAKALDMRWLVACLYSALSFSQLFTAGNFEMATMCFERAGDELRQKWAKAAAYQSTGERILYANFEQARETVALKRAAKIYESIGKMKAAIGWIGRIVMLLFVSGRLTDNLYKKIRVRLNEMLPWKSFIEQLKGLFGPIWKALSTSETRGQTGSKTYLCTGFERSAQEALEKIAGELARVFEGESSVYRESDEQASKEQQPQQEFCYMEYKNPEMAYQELNTGKEFQFNMTQVFQFLSKTAEELLTEKEITKMWVETTSLTATTVFNPLLLSRLVVAISLVHLNSGWDLSQIAKLLCSNEILHDLPKEFSRKVTDNGALRNEK
ncbi:hypothetical protein ACLOJK_023895 [Asimina triloba]